MKDQNFSVESGQSGKPQPTNLELLDRDSHARDAENDQPDGETHPGNASYSLGRLEQDLRLLHSKWQAVEKEMLQRDEQIAGLQRDLDFHQEKKTLLEEDLTVLASEKTALGKELEAALDEIKDLQSKTLDYDRAILARDAEVDAVSSERGALLDEKNRLENELAKLKRSATDVDDRMAVFESKNADLRMQVQELKDYIDGRKNAWDALNAKVCDYENTIEGMSNDLEAHNDVVAAKEEQQASLALKVMELERELAELKGRHSEKNASHAALQEVLEDKSRELGSLNAETMQLHKDTEKLQKKLDRRDTTIRTLRQELKDRNRGHSSLESALADEKATIAKLQASLESADARIASFEKEQKEHDSKAGELGITIGELRERVRLSEPTIMENESRIKDLEDYLAASEKTAEELRDQVAKTASKLEKMSDKAGEQEIRAAELHAVLLETESEKKNLQNELDAQRDLIAVLETEISKKQESLDMLDRNADRLSAIGSGIRELDVRIDDHWLEQANSLVDQSLEPIEHYIVSEEDGSAEPVRYPLAKKELTIGRSRDNDIRINSRYISRVHARIRCDGSRVTIEDAGSKNGFLVNSMPVTSHTLTNGDELEIGESKFKYLDLSSA